MSDQSQINENKTEGKEKEDMLRMATQVVSAYVSKNPLPASDLPEMIRSVYATFDRLSENPLRPAQNRPQKPAVPIYRSVNPDYLICLEDGRKLKMLKRHLRATYNMSPEEYRSKWGLPADYPMVAPKYAAERSAFAKKNGLGRRADAAGNQNK